MDIIICGAGEVGSHAAEVLASSGNNVIVIDNNSGRLQPIEDTMDVAILQGNCASAEVLREAKTADADLLLATTDSDEINLLTAICAKSIGVKRCIARVHHQAFFEQRGLDYRKQYGIDRLICPEYSTALGIAGVLRNPGVLAIESFGGGTIELQEFKVSPNAPVINKPLGKLAMPNGSKVAAVMRNSYTFIPNATSIIESGDVIILVANSKVFQSALKLFRVNDSGRKNLVIMGGPAMAVWLCRALRDLNFSTRLFESDPKRCEELANKLDWVTVFAADPTDPTVFEEEYISQSDVFIALGTDDEQNILGCAWAKRMGVKETIAVTQRPRYLHLLPHVGIDHAFSPRLEAVKEIKEMIEEAPISQVATLVEGVVDVYRIRVGNQSPVVGKPLREATLTPDSLIVAIGSEGNKFLPGPDEVLNPGDIILVVGRHAMEETLKKVFDAR